MILPALPPITETLTPRELEAWRFICAGWQRKELGDLMGIARQTVDKHLERLYPKIHARCAVEAMRQAVRYGVVEIERDTTAALRVRTSQREVLTV